jgi:hypothetical protein
VILSMMTKIRPLWGGWTETEGARTLEQFWGVRGLTYVTNSTESFPPPVDRFLGDEHFQQ